MTGTTFSPRWLSWTLVLALNLIVPLPLGLVCTEGGGRFGIGLAILVYWACGLAACRRSATQGNFLIAGGLVVGGSQFFLVPQVLAGFAALYLWEGVKRRVDAMPAALDGFALTIITGGELLLAALACGVVIHALCRLGQDTVREEAEHEPASRAERI